jgi:hypothetical protein
MQQEEIRLSYSRVKYLKKEEMGTSIYILRRSSHNLIQLFLRKVKKRL